MREQIRTVTLTNPRPIVASNATTTQAVERVTKSYVWVRWNGTSLIKKYRLKDGYEVGNPKAWDSWQVSAEDCARLREREG